MPKRLKTAGRGGCGEEAESPQREGCGQHAPDYDQGEQQIQCQRPLRLHLPADSVDKVGLNVRLTQYAGRILNKNHLLYVE